MHEYFKQAFIFQAMIQMQKDLSPKLWQKLGGDFALTDTGLRRHFTEDSYAHLLGHYNNKPKRHWKLEEQQKPQALRVREIKKQIK